MQTPIYTVHVQSEHVLIIQEEKQWFHVIISLLLTPPPKKKNQSKQRQRKQTNLSYRLCVDVKKYTDTKKKLIKNI